MRLTAAALALICCTGTWAAASPTAAILNDGPEIGGLQTLYQQAGYSVRLMGETDLAGLSAPDVSIFVIPPKSVFPPDGRRYLHRYLTEGGNLAVLSPRAFDYVPRPVDPIPIVDFGREGGYTVTKPETAVSKVIDIPADRRKGIRLTSEFMAHGDLSVNIPLVRHRAADRDMLCVKAKGGYDIVILMLTLEDDDGNRYVAFTDLTRGWKEYAVPMADFAPVSEDKDAPSIDPARAKTLTVSASTRVVWKGAKGHLGVGPISLAKSSRFPGVTTSEVLKWRAACIRTKAVFRDWAIDPFLDSRKLANRQSWEVPGIPAYRGFEDGKVEDVIRLSESRRVAGLQHLDHGRPVTVLESRVYSDGPYRRAAMILSGLEAGGVWTDDPLGSLLIAASNKMVREPTIVRITPETTPDSVRPTQFLLRVSVLNPQDVALDGRVSVTAANEMIGGVHPVTLRPRELTEVVVNLGSIDEEFPMKRFSWSVNLDACGTRDVMSDTVDVERSIIKAAQYALDLQRRHADGRYSIYFFTDIYTARMLFALSRYLENPDVWERNRELLAGMKPSDFRNSAFRFCDMIAAIQSPEGSIPIGYADHRGDMYTADDGTIVLGLLQIASWLPKDDPRAQRYLEVARRYFVFRESMYITPEKSACLQEQFGQGARGTNAGWYGVGVLRSDMFGDDKTIWPDLRPEGRGYQWVMPISMGAVAGLRLLDPSNARYAEVVARDAAEYIGKDYPVSRSSYFHIECLYWMLQAADDPEIRAHLIRKIEQGLPYLLGSSDTLLYFEGRGALHWLNLAYRREQIGDDDRTRAAMLSGIWSLCSESSNYSMLRMADQFPMTTFRPPIGAYRCIVHGSIALMEMLDPGSTQLAPG